MSEKACDQDEHEHASALNRRRLFIGLIRYEGMNCYYTLSLSEGSTSTLRSDPWKVRTTR